MSPLFKPGDLLKSSRYPNYHLFVDEIRGDKYLVHHLFVYEVKASIRYSKNAGHDSLMSFSDIETGGSHGYGTFTKVGYFPGLIGKKSLDIIK